MSRLSRWSLDIVANAIVQQSNRPLYFCNTLWLMCCNYATPKICCNYATPVVFLQLIKNPRISQPPGPFSPLWTLRLFEALWTSLSLWSLWTALSVFECFERLWRCSCYHLTIPVITATSISGLHHLVVNTDRWAYWVYQLDQNSSARLGCVTPSTHNVI